MNSSDQEKTVVLQWLSRVLFTYSWFTIYREMKEILADIIFTKNNLIPWPVVWNIIYIDVNIIVEYLCDWIYKCSST